MQYRTNNPKLAYTVVLLWRNLGPYHIARAKAASQALKRTGGRVVAVQLCGREHTRDWQVGINSSFYEIKTLYPDRELTKKTRPSIRRLTDLLGELQPSHIAVAGYDRPEMRAAMRWGRRNGAGVILMSETKWDDRSRRPWWKRAVIARWLRMTDAALVSGAAATEYMVTMGLRREHIFRQYGVVDNAFFERETATSRERETQPSGAPEGPYFIACARLIESRKNISRLLLAYRQYRQRDQHEPWGLVICGDGDDRDFLEKMVLSHRIDGVIFTGFRQIDELAHWYAHAGCFVHPAVKEAWGLVVNEAMASALPVLVSKRCGCAYDLVREGINGYSFDPYDIEQLATLLDQMASRHAEERIAMGHASSEIISQFGPKQFAEGLCAAIDLFESHRVDKGISTEDHGLARGTDIQTEGDGAVFSKASIADSHH